MEKKAASQKKSEKEGVILSKLVINNDLSKLSEDQKVDYYRMFCERIGLDPLSQPFKILRLGGREVLYCDRTGAQQLNKVHEVSHEIKAREVMSGCYIVTAQASTPNGRRTESIGAVPIDNLKGDALCNAMMKAETKAKRRATLDLLGLGILDETETDSIPGSVQRVDVPAVVTAESPVASVSEETNPFKRKYETEEEILKALYSSREIKEIASLYYVNSEKIEQSVKMKTEFTRIKSIHYNNNNNPTPKN